LVNRKDGEITRLTDHEEKEGCATILNDRRSNTAGPEGDISPTRDADGIDTMNIESPDLIKMR